MLNRLFRNAGLWGFSALLLFGSITASAESRCERPIRKAEIQLEQAVRCHGPCSRQAENKRRELELARAGCHR